MSLADDPGLSPVARLFVRLCEIPSPSRSEEGVARVVRDELADLGAEVSEDGAASLLPAGSGNIVGRFPPTADGGVPIAFAAHMDTVPVEPPIEVVLDGGMFTNAHPQILGGDDKSAVAAMLAGVRQILDEGRPHAGIELLFTPCEEIGLLGAAAFDPTRLNASYGFVYDHTGPLGGIVTSAPWLSKIHASFHGTPAHAGIVPEDGRSAISAAAAAIDRMPLGRIDPETTANVGTISGGAATNVVAPRCELLAEARSRSESALTAQIGAMLDALTAAAAATEVDLETRVVNEFRGYRLTANEPQVQIARDALEGLGYTPELLSSGGGSDVNAFLANGFPAVNLCNDMIDIHTADERIAVDSLERMVDITRAIVERAAAT